MAEMTAAAAQDHGHDDAHLKKEMENKKLGMWIYIASEVVIFAIMIAGYIIFRLNEPDSVKQIHQSLGIALVTANTFVLLMSSWTMVMALRAIQMNRRGEFMRWMAAVCALGTVFLAGQYIEYRELAHLEVTLDALHPEFLGFGMRFYAPTAFHGAHVLIGVLIGLHILWLGRKGHYDNGRWIYVELFGLYWHFVDIVWIFLFTIIYLV